MNNYLLEGEDTFSLELERERIIKEENNISFYDLEEMSLSNALEDIDTYGLFSNQKNIVIRNIQNQKYEEQAKDWDHLFAYLDEPNPDYTIILEGLNFLKTSKIYKELKKRCIHKECKENPNQYIKNRFKDYKIDYKTQNTLLEFCQNDMTKLKQECDKLMLYKINEKEILLQDVEDLVIPKQKDSKDLIFAFTRSIAEKEKEKALREYQELKSYQLEAYSIIGLLASQMRILYQVKLLEKDHSISDIKEILNEKSEYRIQKTKELTKFYSEKEILNTMIELGNMDLKMKSTDVDPDSLMELFLMNL